MSHDTVRLAQPNRNANKLRAQKDSASLLFTENALPVNNGGAVFDAGHFVADKAQAERRRARTQVRNRLSDVCNEGSEKMNKSKRVFWVIWSSD
jgi:hypothetical protein